MTRNRIFMGRKPVEMSARPWSKPIDRKFLNMNTSVSIDDLLKMIDPPLVKNYEKNVLQKEGEMRTISQMSTEYKSLIKQREKVALNYRRLNSVNLIGIVLLVASSFFAGFTLGILMYAGVVLLWIVLVCNVFVSSSRKTELEAKLLEIHSHLENFKEVVQKLRSRHGVWTTVYSEATIREAILASAIKVLQEESSLDEVRMDKPRRTALLMRCCKDLETAQQRFQELVSVAEVEFGITVNKSEVFDSARKVVYRMVG